MKNKNIAIIIFVVALLIIGIFLIFSLGWKREIKNLTNFSQNNFLLTKKEIKTAANNLPKNNERGLRFLFFGDIMLDRNVKIKIDKYGFDYLFSGTTTTSEMWNFNNYDLVSANLEGAVTDNGAHYSPSMSYDFAFAPTDIEQLKKYGFNFFNLANNHLADQGERGIIETRKNLDNLGFSYVGCT
ncbi:MAG: CapA family protein, partial [Candidatus Falkowbacteria bacterium]|nr:CapA family protein [Candidatus Falkowbacteria bacterium]